MAELTLEEAREIYKYDELKAMMLGKFSKEELEKHEVTQKEFDKTFLELLGKCTKTVFLDEDSLKSAVPTNRIELRNDNNEWLFDIQFTGNPPHFYVSKSRVFSAFAKKDNMNSEELRRYIDKFAEIKFGIYGSVCIF